MTSYLHKFRKLTHPSNFSSKKNNSLSEDVFNLCKDKGLLLQELKIEEGRLDDVFREITVADTKIDKESKAGKEEE